MNKPDSLKIGYYNTVYCTDGQTPWGFAKTHINHATGNHKKLPKIADTERAMAFVDSSCFDVVVLSEILGEQQRTELQTKLEERGYNHSHVGHGHGLSGLPGQDVEILIATKQPSEAINLPEIVTPQRMGHGGGLIYTHFPSSNCDIIAAHLALQKNAESFEAQVTALVDKMAERIGKQCERIILIGDLNVTPEELSLRSPELIKGLKLFSPNEATCSTIWPLRLFYNKCIDQIWGKGFKVINSSTYQGQSDHKGVMVELRGS